MKRFILPKAIGRSRGFYIKNEPPIIVGESHTFWLGYMDNDGNSSHNIRISKKLYNDINEEIKKNRAQYKEKKNEHSSS